MVLLGIKRLRRWRQLSQAPKAKGGAIKPKTRAEEIGDLAEPPATNDKSEAEATNQERLLPRQNRTLNQQSDRLNEARLDQ
jgi:hypothetical protein